MERAGRRRGLLVQEARLLDGLHFEEWLELFTEDATYRIPLRASLDRSPDGLWPVERLQLFHIDEDKAGLALRVARLRTGMAHVETPPSRTRHLVANVEVGAVDTKGSGHGRPEVEVRSNLLVRQGHHDGSDHVFSAHRQDRVALANGSWRIAARLVVLDHIVLPRSLSIFF